MHLFQQEVPGAVPGRRSGNRRKDQRDRDVPPLAPLIPTAKGVSLLIDCGANVDARPSHLVQFARMGSIYMEQRYGKEESDSWYCEYRCRRRKGKCTGKRDISTVERMRAISILSEVWKQEIFRMVWQM